MQNETLRNKFDYEYEKLAPICFLYERDTERSRSATFRLKKDFLDGHHNAEDLIKGMSYVSI